MPDELLGDSKVDDIIKAFLATLVELPEFCVISFVGMDISIAISIAPSIGRFDAVRCNLRDVCYAVPHY
ncbi:hypothetical protein HPP92_027850 [Vanilla planifolia]|uniref:Uncharacterized protein n=1 Tax=Vanilla planifolia TaxID=51239 RepID=A0A835PBD3_VANPL|nr:hypothetical protein HPP92_027850 [Vanilla planifolia]